jgi:hypothetical protein
MPFSSADHPLETALDERKAVLSIAVKVFPALRLFAGPDGSDRDRW